MATRVLVTVDFHDVDAVQHLAFRAEMQRRGWILYPNRRESYCIEMRGAHTDAAVLSAVEQDVTEAAEVVCIYDWDAVCVLSGPAPHEITVTIVPRSDQDGDDDESS